MYLGLKCPVKACRNRNLQWLNMLFKHIICTLLFASLSAYAVPADFPFEIEADHIKITDKQHDLYASGNVIITYKNYTIYSDTAHYNKSTATIICHQDVTVTDTDNNSIKADKLLLNIKNNQILLSNSTIKTKHNQYIEAQGVSISEDVVHLTQCSFTTCSSTVPTWKLHSESIEIQRDTQSLQANNNSFLLLGTPVFFLPKYYQSITKSSINNQIKPEFGANQIDAVYFKASYGYLLSKDVSGKVGLGLSQNRGFKYGASHYYAPSKHHTFTLNTYQVSKTGFEGGLRYLWTKSDTDRDVDTLFSTLFSQSEPSNWDAYFSADYLFDRMIYNELYHSLPELKLGIYTRTFYFGSSFRGHLGTGYFVDRYAKQSRHQAYASFENPLYASQPLSINNTLNLNTNMYNSTESWTRLYTTLSFLFPLYITNNTLSYTTFLHQNGRSPFIFDTINQIVDDEISALSTISLSPLILSINTNYQVNKKSFRNLSYSIGWAFQCWQANVSIDTIWNEISFGVSLPSF
jgi:lipopolysaccharide assembly outer membrane protein LptD (OstA)